MQVKEYIKLLQELPQDAEVYIMENSDWGEFADFAAEPYFARELSNDRYIDGRVVKEYVEGVIIR